MSNKYYANEGDTQVFQFMGRMQPSEGMIVMEGLPPCPWCRAQADGTWVEDLDLKTEMQAFEAQIEAELLAGGSE